MIIQIALFDGFDLLDAFAPYEVLGAGGALAGGALTVQLAAADGPREVPSGLGGPRIAAVALDPDRADILIVPGASGAIDGDGPDSVPALLDRAASSGLPALVARAMARRDAIVATVCGGSLILGIAGLLKDRHAVTHHMGLGVLAATGAIVVPARVVDDGNVVSAGGVTSGLDLGLHLLERMLGPRIAHATESLLAYERRGTVWRAEGRAPVPA